MFSSSATTGFASRSSTLLGLGATALAAFLIATPAQAGDQMKGDIVDTAVSAGSFNTLVTAVKAADLVDTLKSEGPFTVFAPTDEAFSAIPKAELDALLADKEALTAVLTYHVVAGKVMAADVVGLSSAETVQGESITIDTSSGVKVDGANVVQTDIETTNGVIHVIDAVIIPSAVKQKMSSADTLLERSVALWERWEYQRSYGR